MPLRDGVKVVAVVVDALRRIDYATGVPGAPTAVLTPPESGEGCVVAPGRQEPSS